MPSTITDRLNGLTTSVAVKAPCRVAATANITLSGEQTIDDVAVVSGDRVLVKEQTSALDNGIWIVSTGTWTRAPDFDGTLDVVGGTQLYVISGTVNGSTYWRADGSGAKTPATDSITFTTISGTTTLASDLASTATGKGAELVGANDASSGAKYTTVQGFITYLLSSAGSAIVGFIQSGAGASARTAQAKMRDIVDVRDFGAAGAETAANNATAITNALTAAGSEVDLGGLTLNVNSFSAVTGKTLRNGKLNWMGDGDQCIDITTVTDFALDDVEIVQDASVSSSADKKGVKINTTSARIQIRNCKFEDFSREAVWAANSTDLTITGNIAINCNRASAATPADATDDYGAFSLFANTYGVNISNNIVRNGGTGISVFGGSTGGDSCGRISITGNTLIGDVTNQSGMGIYALKNLFDITISGNDISDYYNEGIVVVNTDATTAFTATNIAITGNSVRRCAYAGISIEKAGAAHGTSNISITGNSVEGPLSSNTGGHGILLDNDSVSTGSFEQINVCGNVCRSSQSSGTSTNWFGIYAKKGTVVLASNNIMRGTWTECMRDEECRYSTFNGNNFLANVGKKCLVIVPNSASVTPNTYVGNTLHGSDATSYLIDQGGSDELERATIVGNEFHTGILDISNALNCTIVGNTMVSLAGSSVITNPGADGIIAFNGGYNVTEAGTTKTTPGTVDRWEVVETNSTTYYRPLYTSKTT